MSDLPDLNVEWPDAGHEAIRLAIVDHLAQLGDSFLLGQTAADFAQTALAAVTEQAAQIADLQARLAVLENPTPA